MIKYYRLTILMAVCLVMGLILSAPVGAVEPMTSNADLIAAATGDTIQLGQWPGNTGRLMIVTTSDTMTAEAKGPDGTLFYKCPISTEDPLANETYQILMDASIKYDSKTYVPGYGGSDPVVFYLTIENPLHEDIPIIHKIPVHASAFNNSNKLSFLFTLPADDISKCLFLEIEYVNGNEAHSVKNPYNMTLRQVTLNHVTVAGTTAELIVGSNILNSAVTSLNTAYDPRISRGKYKCTEITGTDQKVLVIPVTITIDNNGPDGDKDGISDELERNGYVIDDATNSIKAWNGDTTIKYFKTDPNVYSTDGDPYGDGDEALHNQIPADIIAPANDPMVPAVPNVTADLISYSFTPNGTITLTEGSVQKDKFEEKTTNKRTDTKSWSVDTSTKATVQVKTGIDASTEYNGSVKVDTHNDRKTVTESTKNTTTEHGTEKQWQQATCTEVNNAGSLTLNVGFKNIGSAPVFDFQSVYNVSIGDTLLGTFSAKDKIETLEPQKDSGSQYGWTGEPKPNKDITLSLEQLKALQCGAPITIAPPDTGHVTGMVNKWDDATKSYTHDNSPWANYLGQISNTCAIISLDLNGEIDEYPIYAGNIGAHNPLLNLEQALLHVLPDDYIATTNGVMLKGHPFTKEEWGMAITSSEPKEKLLSYINQELAMHDQNIMQIILKPGMKVNLRLIATDDQFNISNVCYYTDNKQNIDWSALVHPGYQEPIKSVTLYYTPKGQTNEVSKPMDPSQTMLWFWNCSIPDGIQPGTQVTIKAIAEKMGDDNKPEETSTSYTIEKYTPDPPPPTVYVPLEKPVELAKITPNNALKQGIINLVYKNTKGDKDPNDSTKLKADYDYTGADYYVIQVCNNRLSSDDLQVTIEGKKAYLGSGDCSHYWEKQDDDYYKWYKVPGTKYLPLHTTCLVVPAPTGGRTSLAYEWSVGDWSKMGNGKNKTCELTFNLVGCFVSDADAESGYFTLMNNADDDSKRKTFTDVVSQNYTDQILDTGKGGATGYLVKATAHGVSSDDIKVSVNGVVVQLGNSDSHYNGDNNNYDAEDAIAGANYSPIHTETFFVPVDPNAGEKQKGQIKISTKLGSWKGSFYNNVSTNQNYIEIEVLGYFSNAGSSYTPTGTKLKSVKGKDITSSQNLDNETYNYPPIAYLVMVTNHGTNGDSVGLKINGETNYFSASNTWGGYGNDTKKVDHPAVQSHLMLVPAHFYFNPITRKVVLPTTLSIETMTSNFMNDASKYSYDIEVLGYFH